MTAQPEELQVNAGAQEHAIDVEREQPLHGDDEHIERHPSEFEREPSPSTAHWLREASTAVGGPLLLAFAGPAVGLMLLSAVVLFPALVPAMLYLYKGSRSDRRHAPPPHPRAISLDQPAEQH